MNFGTLRDCVSGSRCEVGVHTAENYRRRGFAASTVAATGEHCLATGINQIGWHYWDCNLASAATARAVGFEKVLDYGAVESWLSEFDSLLVNGNLCLLRQQYADAAGRYEKAFEQVGAGAAEVNESKLIARAAHLSSYYYKAACAHALAGGRQSAAEDLSRAIDTSSDRWRLF